MPTITNDKPSTSYMYKGLVQNYGISDTSEMKLP